MTDKLWALLPAQLIVGQFLETFKDSPTSQKGGSFGIAQALEVIQAGSEGPGR